MSGGKRKRDKVEPGSSTIKLVVRPIANEYSRLRRQQSRALEGRTIMPWRHSRCVPDPVRVIQPGNGCPFWHDKKRVRSMNSRLARATARSFGLSFIAEISRLDSCAVIDAILWTSKSIALPLRLMSAADKFDMSRQPVLAS